MEEHQIVKNLKFNQKKQKTVTVYRRCRICNKTKRKDTGFICKQCNVPLHNGNCFITFHLINRPI